MTQTVAKRYIFESSSGGSEKYDFWKDARLGRVEKIELVDVFRYTPQIAKALLYIDQSFPGQDLDDEWPGYSGVSRTEDGQIPTICALNSTLHTYTTVFKRAKEFQRKLGKGRRVAVLCASNDLFLRYLEYKTLREDFYVLASRDDVSGLPNTAKKFIFSMPEYVAGLQFDTVFLIDVNKAEVPDGPYSSASLRKFVSQIYLGASRAERQLELYSSLEQGGIAPLISKAVYEDAVRLVELSQLPEIDPNLKPSAIWLGPLGAACINRNHERIPPRRKTFPRPARHPRLDGHRSGSRVHPLRSDRQPA